MAVAASHSALATLVFKSGPNPRKVAVDHACLKPPIFQPLFNKSEVWAVSLFYFHRVFYEVTLVLVLRFIKAPSVP